MSSIQDDISDMKAYAAWTGREACPTVTIEVMHTLRFLLAATLVAAAAQTAGAQSASGVDLKAMDTAVSPCQNFYQYACGRLAEKQSDSSRSIALGALQ